MKRSISELASLPPAELSAFFSEIDEPLLVTAGGEPSFVAQSLLEFERMKKRLRILEAIATKNRERLGSKRGVVIPFTR